MGGESFFSSDSSSGDVSLAQDQQEFAKTFFPSGNEESSSTSLELDSVINGESWLRCGEFHDVGPKLSATFEAKEKQRHKVYAEVLRSYEDLHSRVERLEEKKSKVLRNPTWIRLYHNYRLINYTLFFYDSIFCYSPGSWVEKDGDLDLHGYDLPNSASLLLIGPIGAGKSSLVNKISRVFEDGVFASGRAQVSYNLSTGDGTCFVQRYLIPRSSGSFCLYDTRSLSDNSCENLDMIKPWMTKGIRHGELVLRKSDTKDLKARLKCKARRGHSSCKVMAINFVIFVVNGLSVLQSMTDDSDMNRKYLQMMATSFNNPLLSFKDDKPVVVVTHGDLLSLSDRLRLHMYLGELLEVPPTRQIFDIPESNDPATTLTIVDMLIYCLERADRNLPSKHRLTDKISTSFILACLFVLMVGAVALLVRSYGSLACTSCAPSDSFQMEEDWHNIRHLWEG